MMQSFWSLVVEPSKVYKKCVESGIHVTRVALDTSKATDKDEGFVQVLLEHEGKTMTIANLSIKHSSFQTELDLMFQCGEEIAFSTSGVKLPVTLTGISGGDEEESDLEEEYDDITEENDLSLENVSGKKRKITSNGTSSKASKLSNGQRKITIKDESFVSEDESDDTYNPVADLANDTADHVLIDESQLTEDFSSTDSDDVMEEDEDSDDELEEEEEEDEEEGESEDDDEEEEDDDDDDDDEEEEEEMEVSPVKSKKHMNGVAEKKQKKSSHSVPSESSKQVSTPVQTKIDKLKLKEASKLTPGKSGKESSKGTPAKEGKKEPKTPLADKKVKADNKENVETPKQKKNKEGKGQKGSEQKTPKQMRAGGVMVEDISVGSGTTAKSSSLVSVYYEGRLKNGKVFDKTMSGPPFKFRLGRGEVIKGWDVGVLGMQVGGKRRISIPPNMGYGKSGSPPVIPSNAHLNFDVTLINCH